ncbi:hypothetical protein C8F01DRAFT_1286871 [Mycena amicta]|nr:hypothetical protein C8F01DRAFT_1286871 [Mycena amicta]
MADDSNIEELFSRLEINSEDTWLYQHLVNDQESILFVGESSNRSLPLALAFMRGSSSGIWASSLHEPWDTASTDPSQKKEQFALILEKAGERQYRSWPISGKWRPGYDRDVHDNSKYQRHALELISKFSDSPASLKDLEARFNLRIDATDLRGESTRILLHPRLVEAPETLPPMHIIWFQCPWAETQAHQSLILDFFTSAAEVQEHGDSLIVGLTAYNGYPYRYADKYKLGKDFILMKQHARELGYESLPVDRDFIRGAIDVGYTHRTAFSKQIHDLILHWHETYVFVKRDDQEEEEEDDSDES